MKARRGTSRVAALVGATPAEVLAATVPRGLGSSLSPAERGMRTAAAVRHVPDGWHWPRWLDRQSRVDHPAFVPPGDAGITENLTGRDWRYVGTVSSGWLAMTDPRGAVAPVGGSWSLDWLVRAEDRWHRPAREAAVRQRTRNGAPVPETACRVPGGDILHRVFGARLPGDLGDAVVVEIENATAVPVAVAFAVRPVDPLGVGSITTLALDDTTVLIDGRPALLFDRRPAQSTVGDAGIDSLAAILTDRVDDEPFALRRDPLGLANVVFVIPVPHRTSLRVVLPLRGDRRDRPTHDGTVPTAETIGRGWDAHADQASHLELPDERLAELYAPAVRSLLLASGDGAVLAPHGDEDRWSVAAEARIVRALHLVGLHEPANAVVRRRGDEFELDGWFRREGPSLARNAAIFHAVGDTWALSRDRATVDAVMGPTVKAAHWSERFRARRSRSITDREAYASHDALSSLSRALEGVEQPEAAQDAAAFAARFVLDHEKPHEDDADEVELPVRAAYGLDVLATVDRAIALAAAGDERAFVAVTWLTEVAGEHGRWPTFVHPRLGTGCAGSGDDPVVAAAIVELVRAFAVRVEGASIALLPVVPSSWLGQSVDVRDVPTPHGRCSFSVRWHGARPALLWEVVPDGAPGPVVITTPGLDPAFRTDQLAGETLLAAPGGAPGRGRGAWGVVQLMDVSIGEDHDLLIDTAARLAAALATTDTATLPPADDVADVWRPLVETGFVGLHLPEAVGGSGASGVDVALVAEQLAKQLCTAPFVGQAVLGPELLWRGGATTDELAPVLAGERRVTVLLDPTLRNLARVGSTGVAFDAAGAHAALALDAAGAVVMVPLAGATRHRSADLTRVLATVDIPADATAIDAPLDAAAAASFEALALAVLAADLVGVMQAALDAAVGYARDRVQFGVPVGSFQAVQHLAADAKVHLESSRGSMWHATWAIDALEPADALLAARQAKAWCARSARTVTETMVQMLGGIAITWEELAHVRVRRALLDRACFGDENAQYDAIVSVRLDGGA